MNKVIALLKRYLDSLEEDEASRLVMKLGDFRDFQLLDQNIKKVSSAAKVYQGRGQRVSHNLPLPYYDLHKKQLYHPFKDAPEEIAAFLLYSLDVMPSFRSALREVIEAKPPVTTAILPNDTGSDGDSNHPQHAGERDYRERGKQQDQRDQRGGGKPRDYQGKQQDHRGGKPPDPRARESSTIVIKPFSSGCFLFRCLLK